jgi:hypothetical protein
VFARHLDEQINCAHQSVFPDFEQEPGKGPCSHGQPLSQNRFMANTHVCPTFLFKTGNLAFTGLYPLSNAAQVWKARFVP